MRVPVKEESYDSFGVSVVVSQGVRCHHECSGVIWTDEREMKAGGGDSDARLQVRSPIQSLVLILLEECWQKTKGGCRGLGVNLTVD